MKMKDMPITQILLLLYVILMPFNMPMSEMPGTNIKMCDALFPLLLLFFLFENRNAILQKLARGKALLYFLPYIAACAVSFLNSADLKRSCAEMAFYAYLLTLSFIAVSVIDREEVFWRVVKSWLFATAIVLAVGAAGIISSFINKPASGMQFVQHTNLDRTFTAISRVKSTFLTPNELLTYLNVSIALAICWFYKFAKKGMAIFASLIFLEAFLTMSRRFGGFMLTVFLALRRFPRTKFFLFVKYASFAVFAAFLILGLLTTIWQVFPIFNDRLSLHFLPHLVSFRMFVSHPFIGSGLGLYRAIFTNFYEPDEIVSKYDLNDGYTMELIRAKEYAIDPHSSLMGTLAETGIIGLLGLVFFFVATYRYLYKSTAGLEPKNRNIAYILIAGLTGFILNGLITDIMTMRQLWFIVSLAIAFSSLKERGGAPGHG